MGSRRRLTCSALVLGLAACGGGGDDTGDDTPPAPVARIEITPGSLLLTQDRREAPLAAVAFDADGNPVDATFTWVSSRPDQVTVDAAGLVRATTALGSATIWAEAGDVRSRRAIVASVELHPGSLAVTDAQVASIDAPFLPPGAPPEAPALVDVRLRDVTVPAPGTVVIAVETQPVGGVVVAAQPDGAEVVVRLESADLPRLFARYDIAWDLALAEYDLELVDAPVLDPPDEPDPARAPAVRPVDEKLLDKKFPIGPAECSASATGYIDNNLFDLSLKGGAKFVFQSQRFDASLPADYLKVALVGPLKVTGSIAMRVKAGFKAAARCEIATRIPMPLGWFAVVVTPAIPIGVGVELKGDVQIATFELGFECRPGMPCTALDKWDRINDFKPLIKVPSGMDDLRTELSFQAYVVSGIELFLGFGAYRFEAVRATFGPVQSAKLAAVQNQARDAAYASEYKLDLKGKLEPGKDFKTALKKLLGEDADDYQVGLEVSIASEVSRSPTGTVSASMSEVPVDRPVRLTFAMQPSSLDYFKIGFNLESFEVYRKRPDDPLWEHVGTVAVSSSSATYTWDWTPGLEDLGQNVFTVFAKTRMPVVELELAPNSQVSVEVVETCGPAAMAARGGGSCQLDGMVSHRTHATGPTGTSTTVTTGSVTLRHDPDGSGGGLTMFRPTGTWSVTHTATVSDCVVTVDPAMPTGTLTEDPSQGAFIVESDGSYHGALATGLFPVTTTLTCPDAPPFVQDQNWGFEMFYVLDSQDFVLDDQNRAMGTYTTNRSDGINTITDTWTWDLTLTDLEPPPPPPGP